MASSSAARAARFLRKSGAAVVAAGFLAALAATGCGDPFGPDPDSVMIRLEVSGGFAGVDWAIEVDGVAGAVRGIRCERGCDFEAGGVILALSDAQISDLASEIEDAGILGHDRALGDECCDQFAYRLVYERGRLDGTVSGSSGVMPAPIARVIARLHGLTEIRIAALVDFASTPGAWPADPLTLDNLSIDGSELSVRVSYGGGCEEHSIDLVFWNGFLESNPVQAEAILAHDARNDPCDAFITTTRRFDLSRLRDRFRDAYGSGSGTIIIQVSEPGSTDRTSIEYHF
jgi:hypothetical protein